MLRRRVPKPTRKNGAWPKQSRPAVEGFAGADAEALEPLRVDRKSLNEKLRAKVKEHLLMPDALLVPVLIGLTSNVRSRS
eukprot:2604247-Alexandrium_andersonii.AAC.1